MTNHERLQFLQESLTNIQKSKEDLSVVNYLHRLLSKHCLPAMHVNHNTTCRDLVAEIGDRGPLLALSSHIDTDQIRASRKTNHWKKTILTAPSIIPLIAMIVAIIELFYLENVSVGRMRLLATIGEMEGLSGPERLIRKGFANDINAMIHTDSVGHRTMYVARGCCSVQVSVQQKGLGRSYSNTIEKNCDALEVFHHLIEEKLCLLNEKKGVLGEKIFHSSSTERIQFSRDTKAMAKVFYVQTDPAVENQQIIQLFEKSAHLLSEALVDTTYSITVLQDESSLLSQLLPPDISQKPSVCSGQQMVGKVTNANDADCDSTSLRLLPIQNKEFPVADQPNGTEFIRHIDYYKDLIRSYFGSHQQQTLFRRSHTYDKATWSVFV